MAFDWKGTIGKVVPWLAGTLGSPAAGVAVGGLCKLFGFEESAENAEKIARKIAAGDLTGDQYIAVLALEKEHAQKMQAMGYENLADLERIASADRASARDREIKTGDSWTPRILAAAVVVGWLAVQFVLFRRIVPIEMRDLIGRSLGTLDMALGLVLGYYFGSSISSMQKNEIVFSAKRDTSK